jgi:mannose-6-phosphate isomerase-like protein (cupin superfamily)
MSGNSEKRYVVRSLADTVGVPCPCGTAYRVLAKQDGQPLSVHYVKISRDARAHYHKRLTETYIVIEGEGYLELDGDRVPLRPGTVVTIPPGVVHRAVGDLYINNIVVPAFDPDDEFEVGTE